jgi:hypothetical protein
MAYKRNQKYPWKPAPAPTVHNQHKPFNPGRHGKVWGSIRFEQDWGKSPVGDSQGPVIGKLFIGERYNELTYAEASMIIDTLRDGMNAHKVGVRLGRTNQHAGYKDSAKYL